MPRRLKSPELTLSNRRIALLVILLGAGWILGCGGPQPLGGEGAACVRLADCAPGLVCLEGRCSSDLSGIDADSRGPGPGGEDPGSGGDAGASSGGSPPAGGTGGGSTGGASSGGSSTGGSGTGGTVMGGAAGSSP